MVRRLNPSVQIFRKVKLVFLSLVSILAFLPTWHSLLLWFFNIQIRCSAPRQSLNREVHVQKEPPLQWKVSFTFTRRLSGNFMDVIWWMQWSQAPQKMKPIATQSRSPGKELILHCQAIWFPKLGQCCTSTWDRLCFESPVWDKCCPTSRGV